MFSPGSWSEPSPDQAALVYAECEDAAHCAMATIVESQGLVRGGLSAHQDVSSLASGSRTLQGWAKEHHL